MVKLSVNVNKIATLRNSRGGQEPSVIAAVDTCIAAGAPGITVHPRGDERHIRRADVREMAAHLRELNAGKPPAQQIEFNIEGDPRPDLIELVTDVRPTQCTLVPVVPGEITSQAGWPPSTPADWLGGVVRQMQQRGIRVSLFIDPEEAAADWAADLGANRVELYTEPFAKAFARGEGRESFARYEAAARRAASRGLGVNAGHDLDLENLHLFRTLPHLDEVSIGHALVSRALWVGLDRVVKEYVAVLTSTL